MIRITRIGTPIGEMVAGATEEGICLLEYCNRNKLSSECKTLSDLLGTSVEEGYCDNLEEMRKQLEQYFNGQRMAFDIPLVTPGTDFQVAVWKELLNIPFGTTISYLELAKAMNRPGSVRAVANANGTNRISIVIPCHRVIGSDGSLTGYGGGITKKQWLIDHEKKYSGKATELSLF